MHNKEKARLYHWRLFFLHRDTIRCDSCISPSHAWIPYHLENGLPLFGVTTNVDGIGRQLALSPVLCTITRKLLLSRPLELNHPVASGVSYVWDHTKWGTLPSSPFLPPTRAHYEPDRTNNISMNLVTLESRSRLPCRQVNRSLNLKHPSPDIQILCLTHISRLLSNLDTRIHLHSYLGIMWSFLN